MNSCTAVRLCFSLIAKLVNKTCDEDGERKLKKIEFIGCGGVPKAELRQFQAVLKANGVELKLFEEGKDEDGDHVDEEKQDDLNLN